MTTSAAYPNGLLKEMREDIKDVSKIVARIEGELKNKLHEPASCDLRVAVAELKTAMSNSKSFLAGILFLAGFLGSGITLGLGLLLQWLKG